MDWQLMLREVLIIAVITVTALIFGGCYDHYGRPVPEEIMKKAEGEQLQIEKEVEFNRIVAYFKDLPPQNGNKLLFMSKEEHDNQITEMLNKGYDLTKYMDAHTFFYNLKNESNENPGHVFFGFKSIRITDTLMDMGDEFDLQKFKDTYARVINELSVTEVGSRVLEHRQVYRGQRAVQETLDRLEIEINLNVLIGVRFPDDGDTTEAETPQP